MERDTTAPSSVDTASAEMAGAASATDSAGAAADQALTADTTAAANSEMARDTSSAAGTGDTATVAVTDSGIAAESDTTGNIQVRVDTATTEQADNDNSRAAAAAGAVAGAAVASNGNANGSNGNASDRNADATRDNAGRVRPPEDSTEILGNVTTDSATTGNSDVASQSESDRIRPPEDSTEVHGNVTSDKDRVAATSGEADTSAVGAAGMGRTVTGAEAVALLSRAGERCVLLNDESTEASWDIGDSPANLNPCGTGTMTLSRVRTGEMH